MNRESQKNVIMVDDDSEVVFVIRRALNNAEIDVNFDAVDSGAKLLERLAQSDTPAPDLILLDINMPLMNGYDVLGVLRGEKLWRNLPVIMLTSSNSEADKKKSMALGANAFVTKPISQAEMSDFLSRIETCIPERDFRKVAH